MDLAAVNLLVDLIRTQTDAPLEALDDRQLQGVVDLLFSAMWADGDASDDEYEEIAALLAATPWFERVNPLALEQMFDRATAAAGTLAGLATHAERTRALRTRAALLPSQKLRDVVYRMVVSVTLADRVLDPSERDFLVLLAAALDIPDDHALRLLAKSAPHESP